MDWQELVALIIVALCGCAAVIYLIRSFKGRRCCDCAKSQCDSKLK